LHIRAIQALQTPLAACPEPFVALAEANGLTVAELLAAGRELLASGRMRRYAAVLHHRAAGWAVNVLAAWQVPAEQADAFGAAAAEMPFVSHCYLRATAEGWPYNLYAMVHAADQTSADAHIAELQALGPYPRQLLPTRQEFKKAKIRLFSPELTRWEEAAER
jgi:DNA-binding Lrp family transcriptional regulator